MKVRDILKKLDHHYQMAAAWTAAMNFLQRSLDNQADAIPVAKGVRSTMVTSETVDQIQEEIRDRIELHEQMVKKYEEVVGDTKTLPKEPVPITLAVEAPKPTKKKGKPKESAEEEKKVEPETPEQQEASNG